MAAENPLSLRIRGHSRHKTRCCREVWSLSSSFHLVGDGQGHVILSHVEGALAEGSRLWGLQERNSTPPRVQGHSRSLLRSGPLETDSELEIRVGKVSRAMFLGMIPVRKEEAGLSEGEP